MDYMSLTTEELRALAAYNRDRYSLCADRMKTDDMWVYHNKLVQIIGELKKREEEQVLIGGE